MTAVSCRNAADRKAETWKAELAPFSRLEFAVSDAAKAIAAAVERVAAGRHGEADAGPAPEHGLDVFHTTMEAHRVLARYRRHAEAAWDEAEAADVRVARARQQGVDARGPAGPARTAWRTATAAPEQVEHLGEARRRAHAGLETFRPDGRPNDRATAEAEITAASPGLPGADWAEVRNFLRDRRSLASLDRMHRRSEGAEPRRAWREAMAWRWWLRHRRPTTSDPVMASVQAVGRERPLTGPEQASYDRVVAVLGDTVRARQRRRVHEQRAADAAVATPPDDATEARPEAAVLELPIVPLRPEEGCLPVPGVGPGLAHVRLLGAASYRSGPVDATTVNSRKCRMRQSPA